MRPRVFLSSVIEDFHEFRQAAREAISSAGAFPVLIEDQPSRHDSPRSACLDLVASCDAVVLLVGARGGFRTNSGKLAVQEEFEEARNRAIPTIVLLQECRRDKDASELADLLSDWQKGRLRRVFNTTDELSTELQAALEPLIPNMIKPPQDRRIFSHYFEDSRNYAGAAEGILRIALAPKHKVVLADELELTTERLEREVQTAAHSLGLFDFRIAKSVAKELGFLRITQDTERGFEFAEIEIHADGPLLLSAQAIESDLDSWGFGDRQLSSSFEIPKSYLKKIAGVQFRLAHSLLELLDQHGRIESWLLQVGILNPGMRRIVNSPARSNRAVGMGLGRPNVVTAFDSPREIGRTAILNPDSEIERFVSLLEHRLSQTHRY